MLLASATPSASSAKVWIVSTGPKTSSVRISLPGVGVDQDRRAEVEPAQLVVGAAAQDRPRAVGHGPLDEAAHPLEVRPGDHGADVGGLVARVALDDRAGLGHHALGELVGDRLVDEDAGTRRGRPGRRCRTARRRGRRRGRGRSPRRPAAGDLPPSSKESGTMLGAAACAMTPAVGTEPVKAEPVDARVSGERRPGLQPGALHDVEHAGGDACLGHDVGEQARGQRRPLRRLEDDGVAGRQGRSDPPGGEHQRRVPGRDDRDDTGGVVGDPLAVAADLQVGVAELLLGVVGEVAEVHRDPRHHAATVAADAATRCRGSRPAKVLDPLLDAVRDPAQDLRALRDRQRGPGRERRAGRGDGEVDLGGATRGDLGRARPRRSARRRRRCASEATRWPPIQWRRSTGTPSTSAVCCCMWSSGRPGGAGRVRGR